MKRESVKQHNRRLVLDFLRRSETVSIAEITSNVRLSDPTVRKILQHYCTIGLVHPNGKGNSSLEGGKRPDLYCLNNSFGFVIALHVGPDFIYAALADLQFRTSDAIHEPVEGTPSAKQIIDRLVSIARALEKKAIAYGGKVLNVVIALPGIVNIDTGDSVYSPHYPQWEYNFPFKSTFKKAFKKNIPVYIDGVNRLQAIAELMVGKAKGMTNFLILDAMEEGVGAGIVEGGEILHGLNHLAGEVGHIIVDPRGPKCICGGVGCFEAAVSMKHIRALLAEGYETHSDSILYQTKRPAEISLQELFLAAEEGDAYSVKLIEMIVNYFAIGLNNVSMTIDPELIVIQGIYVEAGLQFLKSIRDRLAKLSLPRVERNVSLVYSTFGIERGALGAGCFGITEFFMRPELYR